MLWHVEESDNGVTYVVRLGLEVDYNYLYARFEAAAVGKIYDYDKSIQGEISGIVGVNVTDNVRFEVAGNYFTEWEEYYFTGGVSVGF